MWYALCKVSTMSSGMSMPALSRMLSLYSISLSCHPIGFGIVLFVTRLMLRMGTFGKRANEKGQWSDVVALVSAIFPR